MENTILLSQKNCPVAGEYDVVVCGGGPAGIGAAIAAAKNGASVAIVDRFGGFGGLATLGQTTNCEGGVYLSGDKQLIGGVFEEFLNSLLEKKGALRGNDLIQNHIFYACDESRCENDLQIVMVEVETFKQAADEFMDKYGVDVYFFTMITDVVMDGSKIQGIIIDNKNGKQILLGKQFVDCTGEAWVANKAGAETILPNPKAPIELNFRAAGIRNVIDSYQGNMKELPYGAVNFFPLPHSNHFRFEMTRYLGNSAEADDLSTAMVECRKQVPVLINWLKENWSGCENMFLLDSAEWIGCMAYRTVVGEHQLTIKESLELKIPEDSVLLSGYGVDLHSHEEGGQNHLIYLQPGQCFGIRYGCLIPKTPTDNILVAGRAISREPGVGTELIAVTMSTGEAAGTACALSIKNNVKPRDLDVTVLREQLLAQGVLLQPKPAAKFDGYYLQR